MYKNGHQKRILLVEDLEDFHKPVVRWLEDKGYTVTLAVSYDEAMQYLLETRFHLAIIDIRLDDDDTSNEEGMVLIEEMRRLGLADTTACIVLSGHARKRHVLTAMDNEIAAVVEKNPGYLRELMARTEKVFNEKVQINFDLIHDEPPNTLRNIAREVRWESEKPPLPQLTEEVKDLIGHLFHKAERVFVSKMTPGLTGAVVARVRPTWPPGRGHSFVLKISRREKTKTEEKRYCEYVHNFLPTNTIDLTGSAYTPHLGALQYTFAGGDVEPLIDFDRYYRQQPAERIVECLQQLFKNTCHFWYTDRENIFSHIPTLYYEAFELDEQKLVRRIKEVLPLFDIEAKTFRLTPQPNKWTNPLHWLHQHHTECEMDVYYSITHGDLTGRNIMVDNAGVCWLIDFYRTYPSHILRDFVILETDIKYRLLPPLGQAAFLTMEENLLRPELPPSLANSSSDIRKAFTVVQAVRTVGKEFTQRPNVEPTFVRREYLLSLLMATLNVVRLRHIAADRKRQALLSASLICDELDRVR